MPMTGSLSLYFHIPFCNKKCPYCHFYVVPNQDTHKETLLEALLCEYSLHLPLIQKHEVVSIYFGGGTPTLFGSKAIENILHRIFSTARVAKNCEITIEANPEDISPSFMEAYRLAGINRVSIGIQALEEASLQILERRHSAKKALSAIEDTFLAGFTNISIDLMYELPSQTVESFQFTLSQLLSLPIIHLSLYNLTIEPNTSFFKRTLALPSQEEGAQMLQLAISAIEKLGLKRYEISAFSKPGFESKHNIGYWTARPFFGFGPSAFSYYEGRRYRKLANLRSYIQALKNQTSPIDFEETLSYPENVHELFAVQLRLLEGADLTQFTLPSDTHLLLQQLIENKFLLKDGNIVKLSEKGLLFYDTVASELI